MPIPGPKLDRPITLANLLDIGLRTNPDAPALILLPRVWSWRELDADSTQLAHNYLALGLVPGDRIASLLPNRGALIIHYLACCKAGLVATPLNYRYQTPEIDHALEVSGASMLVAHAERNDILATSKLVSGLPHGRITFEAPPTDNTFPHLENLMTRSVINLPPSPLRLPPSSTPLFIFFTSGSTGKPKGVTHTHETFGWMVASAIAGLGITPADVFLPATSASHVACSSLSFAGLAAGATVALARTFTPDELLPLLRKARPTLLCTLPAPLFALVRDPGASAADFASISRCVSGGDKISAELDHEYNAIAGHEIEELYGMTETGTSTFNPSGPGNRVGSIGQVAPGFTASIRKDTAPLKTVAEFAKNSDSLRTSLNSGESSYKNPRREALSTELANELPANTTGRLWIRSPSNMIGYWNHPYATAETIVDDWLDTGDLVAADPDGYLWFHGRKKQIIIHDGSNICPQEVEDSLLEHPAVATAGVIGIHNLIHGENVRAYITLRPEAPPPTVAELIAFSKQRVGYKAPDEIIVLDEMPTNAVGKVDRVALKSLALECHSERSAAK